MKVTIDLEEYPSVARLADECGVDKSNPKSWIAFYVAGLINEVHTRSISVDVANAASALRVSLELALSGLGTEPLTDDQKFVARHAASSAFELIDDMEAKP
jgi:hypothetical protein